MILPANKEERAKFFCECVSLELIGMLSMKRQVKPLTQSEKTYAKRMMKEGAQPSDVARMLATLHHTFSDEVAAAGVNSLNASLAIKILGRLFGKRTEAKDGARQISILEFLNVRYLVYSEPPTASRGPVTQS